MRAVRAATDTRAHDNCGCAPTTPSPPARSASTGALLGLCARNRAGIPGAGSGRAAHNYRELDESPRRLNLTRQQDSPSWA